LLTSSTYKTVVPEWSGIKDRSKGKRDMGAFATRKKKEGARNRERDKRATTI